MPAEWEFECQGRGCEGHRFLAQTREPQACPRGHGPAEFRRVFTFGAFHREMPGQYSQAVGRYVQNKRDFKSALSRASDEASENTGMEHRFVPIDMADRDATRVTEE